MRSEPHLVAPRRDTCGERLAQRLVGKRSRAQRLRTHDIHDQLADEAIGGYHRGPGDVRRHRGRSVGSVLADHAVGEHGVRP